MLLYLAKTKKFSFRRGIFMNYEINEGTLAIIPSEKESKVLEDKGEYIIPKRPSGYSE